MVFIAVGAGQNHERVMNRTADAPVTADGKTPPGQPVTFRLRLSNPFARQMDRLQIGPIQIQAGAAGPVKYHGLGATVDDVHTAANGVGLLKTGVVQMQFYRFYPFFQDNGQRQVLF